MNTIRQGSSVLLCCGKGRCPSLRKSEEKEDYYDLKDDFGDTVVLGEEHLLAIKEAFQTIIDTVKQDSSVSLVEERLVKCPVLRKSKEKEDHYELADDFGNKVLLEEEHLLAIKEAFQSLNDD